MTATRERSRGEAGPGRATRRRPSRPKQDERSPSFEPGRLREVRRRDLLVRFAAGALTSVVAGIITLVWGPRVGGVFLAFPAILAASLTLIDEEEATEDAREDSRGAIAGGIALAAFAGVAYVGFGTLPAAATLALAAAVWLAVALVLYAGIRRRG